MLAEVTGAWTTTDPDVAQKLSDFHIYGPEFSQQRLSWRHKQPVTILELRARQAQQPLVLPAKSGYWGCFSWVDLDIDPLYTEQIWDDAIPALNPDCCTQLQQLLRQRLQHVTGVEVISPDNKPCL